MPTTTDPNILNPAAYGTVPVIPPTSTNTSNQTSGWETSIPNYAALASQSSANIGNQLSGTLNPQDIANAQTWAAQRGVSTGTGFNSPNNMAAYQQFLGLSSQQLEQQGQTNLNASLSASPRTTNTSGSQTTDNNVLAAITAAAPNPYAAAMANLAAQQQGLKTGGGSVAGPGAAPQVGGGATRSPGGPNPIGPSSASGALGPFPQGGSTYNPSAGVTSGAPAGNMQGGQGYSPWTGGSGQQGSLQPVQDSQGNEWVDLGDGTYMNLTTGDMQQGTPGASSVYGGINLGGGQTIDQFNSGGLSQGQYGSMPDYSQPGADPMAGLASGGDLFSSGGDIYGMDSSWYSGGSDSGGVTQPDYGSSPYYSGGQDVQSWGDYSTPAYSAPDYSYGGDTYGMDDSWYG